MQPGMHAMVGDKMPPLRQQFKELKRKGSRGKQVANAKAPPMQPGMHAGEECVGVPDALQAPEVEEQTDPAQDGEMGEAEYGQVSDSEDSHFLDNGFSDEDGDGRASVAGEHSVWHLKNKVVRRWPESTAYGT